jgi:hypothetical protein
MIKNLIIRTLFISFGFVFLLGHMNASAQADVKKDSAKGWRQLFNGKNLNGWKQVGPGTRYVKDGVILDKGKIQLLYYPGCL